MEESKLNDFVWAFRYRTYLKLRKKGLRKAAFAELEKFILSFKMQDKASRWNYIDIINQLAHETNDYNLYLPWNLDKKILEPELNEWIKMEPNNPIPYKWSLDFSLLKKSLELNPFDQQTLDIYYTQLINKIRLNQHEIEFGFGYSGDPKEDLDLIDSSEQYIANISDDKKREKIRRDMQMLSISALKMIAKQK